MTKPRTAFLLEQAQALDSLLDKIVCRTALRLVTDTEGSGRSADGSRRAVTTIGEALHAAGGVDLMEHVREFIIGLDPNDYERRKSILNACWDGIGDEDERFEPTSSSFHF
jgi:hypothetical protein